MTDNRITEQRKMLNKLLIELEALENVLETPLSGMTLGEYEQEREKLLDGFIQDIAATLGSGTLTAEQVREAIFDGSSYASYDGAQYYANGIDMQVIADELNNLLRNKINEVVDVDEHDHEEYEEIMAKYVEKIRLGLVL